ncbi:MAG: RNA 3'-terminal phosphate cyclase [Candidatus Hydrogenedentes bacterium ADurb.Bin179]|nr:MAG: RNA 3'-terminal phosphate cyclase [Candidatus Hydrogenedentes bacterium ADurb.Bin179]
MDVPAVLTHARRGEEGVAGPGVPGGEALSISSLTTGTQGIRDVSGLWGMTTPCRRASSQNRSPGAPRKAGPGNGSPFLTTTTGPGDGTGKGVPRRRDSAAPVSRVRITGGTHVPHAPTGEYLRRVYLPMLARMGVSAAVEMPRAGFYPRGGRYLTGASQ